MWVGNRWHVSGVFGGKFEYLNGNPLRTISLCGRNAVQLIPGVKGDIDFAELSKSIGAFGSVQFNDFLLKCSSPPYEITLFKDGRAIVKGTRKLRSPDPFTPKWWDCS